MADVAIYNKSLSPSAVINHYVAATGTPFAIQMIPGGIIQDTKPLGISHDGLNFKTAWLASSTDYASAVRTGVAQFSSANRGQIATPSDSDFNVTNGTICFWMKYLAPLPPLPAGNEAEMLFDRRTTNGTVITYNDNGYIQFQANGGARFVCSTYYVADGNWHHVAVTLDQASNAPVSVYIDGNLDTSALNPDNWSWPVSQEIELGRSHDSYWRVYDGQMDDFRIYNRILTPSEIATIANPSTADSLVDNNALVLRYNFDSSAFGHSVVWPYGFLQNSPALGSGAVWTTITNAISPMPILPTAPANFYRLMHE
jgi:hypothetical protein